MLKAAFWVRDRVRIETRHIVGVDLNDVQARLTNGRDRSVARLQTSPMILGDLFDVIEQIHARTAEEHIAWERRPKTGGSESAECQGDLHLGGLVLSSSSLMSMA
jgi:hypothetical protein